MKRITRSLVATFAFFTFVGAPPLTLQTALADVKHNSAVEQQRNAATELIDINSASPKELRSLPGIGKVYSNKIVKGRPYKAVDELRTRKVLPKGIYATIQDKVMVRSK